MKQQKTAVRVASLAVASGLAVALAGCSGSGGGSGDEGLTMLIGSSGDAETQAVQSAVDAWSEESGVDVEVVAASDLTQQLGQGFSGNNPPDIFYMSWDQFQTYASNQYLEPYASDLANSGDFLPTLTETFTFEDEFYCAPKDFSTLGLVINTDLWAAAGLTDADIPTDWASLQNAAQRLTDSGVTGLSFGAEYARIGLFMNQAGGSIVSEDGTEVTADSPENVEGLEYVQGLLEAGVLQFPADLGAGWAGEAFGTGTAGMVIEGPWINGALEADYPDVNYQVVELPAGPGGQSTYSFSNCWGIPAGSENLEDTTGLVEFLTSDEQQLAFADAFGVIPSTEAASQEYATTYPENQAFVAGAEYAESPVAFAGAADVIADFNASLESLDSADPQALLSDLQSNLEAALEESRG
ncbi:sugar ABC transporter substrate-binding protein [Herbiconiux sp. SYSU D00978]|uniref:sugar ABC transporter substrate-binding protein n=1 Tax=Herbiconiux sp. SYSU D00978 TaxID=2812562 RepID=UPI001A95E6D0|nr:extracellular solute-binding protein [Herbiconiux sp. SYSU D00978]